MVAIIIIIGINIRIKNPHPKLDQILLLIFSLTFWENFGNTESKIIPTISIDINENKLAVAFAANPAPTAINAFCLVFFDCSTIVASTCPSILDPLSCFISSDAVYLIFPFTIAVDLRIIWPTFALIPFPIFP